MIFFSFFFAFLCVLCGIGLFNLGPPHPLGMWVGIIAAVLVTLPFLFLFLCVKRRDMTQRAPQRPAPPSIAPEPPVQGTRPDREKRPEEALRPRRVPTAAERAAHEAFLEEQREEGLRILEELTDTFTQMEELNAAWRVSLHNRLVENGTIAPENLDAVNRVENDEGPDSVVIVPGDVTRMTPIRTAAARRRDPPGDDEQDDDDTIDEDEEEETSEEEEEEERAEGERGADRPAMMCRICRQKEPQRELFAPCQCRGSSMYVHRKCLEHWRRVTGNPEHRQICAECKAPYRTLLIRSEKRRKEDIILASRFFRRRRQAQQQQQSESNLTAASSSSATTHTTRAGIGSPSSTIPKDVAL